MAAQGLAGRAPRPASAMAQERRRAAAGGRLIEQWRRWAPVVVLIGLCLVIGAFNANFFSTGNLVRLLNSAAIPVVLCMGATFVILMGSIDLSVEGVVALAAVVASLLVANDVTAIAIGHLAIVPALAVGAALGFLNGWLHIRLKTPSFMTTLGMGFVGLGIATAILGGVTVRISDQSFRYLSLGRPLGVPMAVWVAALCVVVALVIQERTRFGRWVYAIGADEVTARQAGVPVERTRILAFVIAGVFAALGGVLAAAQFGQGHALIANGRLFTTIAAVIVGGTALSGGVGSVLNSVIGVFIVVVLANGMVLMGIPPYVQQGAQGLLIIAAVALALDRSKLAVVK
jgi:ribose transport system permease protein